MLIDWTFTLSAISAVATVAAAVSSAISANASRVVAQSLIRAKVEMVQDKLRVPNDCIKKDAKGYYVPGYGRLSVETSQHEQLEKQLKNEKRKVLFVCQDVTSVDSDETVWVIESIEPL